MSVYLTSKKDFFYHKEHEGNEDKKIKQRKK